jgi:hypothetical protein
MRRDEGSSGSQANREDMERMAGGSGATGATSTGMQDTGGTTYQQQGYPQQGYPQQGYQQQSGQAAARREGYGPSGYSRPAPSRRGAGLSILAGALAFLMGLSFVIRAGFYHATVVGYAYRWTLHGWGWVLLVLGAILVAGGVSILLGIKGSRQFTAAIAVITAVIAFLTIFYSVVWSIVVVAACAFAAHDLLIDRGGDERADAMGYGQGQAYYGDVGQGDQRQQAMSGQAKGSHRM